MSDETLEVDVRSAVEKVGREDDIKESLGIRYPQQDAVLTDNRDAIFDEWRMRGPVVWADGVMGIGSWMVLSYEACRTVAREHTKLNRRFMLDPKLAPADDEPNRFFQKNALFFSEDPDHSRIRGLFKGLIGHEVVQLLTPKIDAFFSRILLELREREEIDVIYDLVYPLCWVVNDFIGIDPEDAWRFTAWQAERPNSRHLRIVPYGLLSHIHARSISEQMELMQQTVAYRRRYPRDDLITKLVKKMDSGYAVTDAEVALNAQFFGMATFDALRDQLSGSIWALLLHQDELADLSHDPSLMPNAVEELLRFVTPDQLLRRITTEEFRVGDICIPARELVTAVMGAGNRDPLIFSDPHRLWLRRPNASCNLAFGVGPFSCIAFLIVKAIMSVALLRLLEVLPSWQIEKIGWLDQPQIRSLRYFSVRVRNQETCA